MKQHALEGILCHSIGKRSSIEITLAGGLMSTAVETVQIAQAMFYAFLVGQTRNTNSLK